MNNQILSEKQKLLINNLPDTVLDRFYLAGGTALSAFYLEQSAALVKTRTKFQK